MNTSPSLAPRAEALRLVIGMSAVCAFAAIGVLHLYDALSAVWYVGGSIAAVAVIAFVIAWQEEA